MENWTTVQHHYLESLCDVDIKWPPAVILQTYQSSPGGHSSCSSEPSPLGSTNNNDSGVEMAMHSGGSFGDLSAQDECPMVDSTVPAGGQQAGMGLHLRKAVGHAGTVTIKLENIKKERLKTVSTSDWVNSAAQPLQGQRSSVKLPPIPAVGESLGFSVAMRTATNLFSFCTLLFYVRGSTQTHPDQEGTSTICVPN